MDLPPDHRPISFVVLPRLDRLDVFSARTFLSHTFGVGDLLAGRQLIEFDPLDGRRVEEQVFAAHCRNEPESLVQNLLDDTFGHVCIPRNDCLDGTFVGVQCQFTSIN